MVKKSWRQHRGPNYTLQPLTPASPGPSDSRMFLANCRTVCSLTENPSVVDMARSQIRIDLGKSKIYFFILPLCGSTGFRKTLRLDVERGGCLPVRMSGFRGKSMILSLVLSSFVVSSGDWHPAPVHHAHSLRFPPQWIRPVYSCLQSRPASQWKAIAGNLLHVVAQTGGRPSGTPTTRITHHRLCKCSHTGVPSDRDW